MTFLAIAYPNINDSDYRWIQDIRQEHDRQFSIVEPHITLVFSTNKLDPSEFTEHIRDSLAKFRSFPITLDSARIIEDDSKNFFHAFLVPSNGFSEIEKLHDLLYHGALKSELRLDIPFIPHLGIGSGSKAEMATLVDQVNSQKITISGYLEKVSIVEYDGSKVKDLSTVSLL